MAGARHIAVFLPRHCTARPCLFFRVCTLFLPKTGHDSPNQTSGFVLPSSGVRLRQPRRGRDKPGSSRFVGKRAKGDRRVPLLAYHLLQRQPARDSQAKPIVLQLVSPTRVRNRNAGAVGRTQVTVLAGTRKWPACFSNFSERARRNQSTILAACNQGTSSSLSCSG